MEENKKYKVRFEFVQYFEAECESREDALDLKTDIIYTPGDVFHRFKQTDEIYWRNYEALENGEEISRDD